MIRLDQYIGLWSGLFVRVLDSAMTVRALGSLLRVWNVLVWFSRSLLCPRNVNDSIFVCARVPTPSPFSPDAYMCYALTRLVFPLSAARDGSLGDYVDLHNVSGKRVTIVDNERTCM